MQSRLLGKGRQDPMRTLVGKYFDFGKCFMVRVMFDWSLEGNISVDTDSSGKKGKDIPGEPTLYVYVQIPANVEVASFSEFNLIFVLLYFSK